MNSDMNICIILSRSPGFLSSVLRCMVGMTLQNYSFRLEFVSLFYGTNDSKLVM